MNEIAFQLSEAERQKLIEQYLPYVYKLARQVHQKLSGRFDLEDLAAYGMLGLVEAAERFNPQRGVSFITFCHYRIKGSIFDGLKAMGLPPRVVNKQISKFEQAATALMQSAADDAATHKGEQSVEDEVQSVARLIDNLIPAYLLSLDSEEARSVPDSNQISAHEEIENQELIELVRSIVEELPEQEREMLTAIYYKHVSMTEFANLKGITKSWVSRLHTRAVLRIRDRLQEIGFITADDSAAKENPPLGVRKSLTQV